MKPQNPELAALGAKLETKIPAGVESKIVDSKIRFELPKLEHVEEFLLAWANNRANWGRGAVWSIKFYDITLPASSASTPDGKLVDVAARFEIYKDANVPDAIRYWISNKAQFNNSNVIAANVVSVNIVNQDSLPKSSPAWINDGITPPPEGTFEDRIPPLDEIKTVFVEAAKRV